MARDIGKLLFTDVYPLYVQKVERKGRTRAEVNTIVCWLTGYTPEQLEQHTTHNIDFRDFFEQAPQFHPNAGLIRGLICGKRVEEIEDPLTQKVRYLDKLIDELAKGKVMEKILR
jgi:hypothetical protein